ncbi:MAG: hypothetical protein ACYTX0_02530 [Nostoc sp.]
MGSLKKILFTEFKYCCCNLVNKIPVLTTAWAFVTNKTADVKNEVVVVTTACLFVANADVVVTIA